MKRRLTVISITSVLLTIAAQPAFAAFTNLGL